MIGRAFAAAKVSAGATAAKVAIVATVAAVSVATIGSSVAPTEPGRAIEVPVGQTDTQFLITGVTTTRELAPGASAPVELTLRNPSGLDLTVTSLTVQIGGVRVGSNPEQCLPDNFAIRQYSGSYGFVVGAMRTVSFTELGIAMADWPEITMINLPVNQDACKNARISFAFAGEAAGATA